MATSAQPTPSYQFESIPSLKQANTELNQVLSTLTKQQENITKAVEDVFETIQKSLGTAKDALGKVDLSKNAETLAKPQGQLTAAKAYLTELEKKVESKDQQTLTDLKKLVDVEFQAKKTSEDAQKKAKEAKDNLDNFKPADEKKADEERKPLDEAQKQADTAVKDAEKALKAATEELKKLTGDDSTHLAAQAYNEVKLLEQNVNTLKTNIDKVQKMKDARLARINAVVIPGENVSESPHKSKFEITFGKVVALIAAFFVLGTLFGKPLFRMFVSLVSRAIHHNSQSVAQSRV